VAVVIRMKKLGRKHRHFFRIVAIDGRQPRDGRVIEELGTYDPNVRDTDSRVTLVPDRIKHWMGVGALPSERVQTLLKKYMAKYEKLAADKAAEKAAEPAATPAA
jgi:small subunit ribosomal protein S16